MQAVSRRSAEGFRGCETTVRDTMCDTRDLSRNVSKPVRCAPPEWLRGGPWTLEHSELAKRAQPP